MSTPHPQMRAILDELAASAFPNPETTPLPQARAHFLRANERWNIDLPEIASRDVVIGGVPGELLTPNDAHGLIVLIHGGGWTFGSPASHARFSRLLARDAGARVLVPDYRLAPEHPAPAAIDDILSVLAEIEEPIVLCGDSAGANIALAAALEHRHGIAMLSLLYGCFAPIFDTGSHRSNGCGRFGLSTARMRWYWNNWQGPDPDPRSAPLYATLEGLPRCHLVAATLDCLCDDTLLLAGRLAEAHVPTRLDIIAGVVHGFLQMTTRLEPARAVTSLIAAEIKSALRNQ